MADLQAAIDKGQAALDGLYKLQTAAMQTDDIVTQKALEDDIDALMYGLTQLNSQAVEANDAQIDALSKQLDAVTDSAQSSLDDLKNLGDTLNSVVAAAKIIDQIVGIATKL